MLVNTSYQYYKEKQKGEIVMENKKYETIDGRKARLVCINLKGMLPFAWAVDYGEAEYIIRTTENLYSSVNYEAPYIIEVSPYKNWEIDKQVMVKNNTDKLWTKSYYAGLWDEKKPTVWETGQTSWTTKNNDRCIYDEVREPTEEELKD